MRERNGGSRRPSDETVIFLSWIQFHGRSWGLANALGIPAIFIASSDINPIRRYLEQWKKTFSALRGYPHLRKVILMLPPFPALLAAALFRNIEIAGDLHTGVFYDKKWRWAYPTTAFILRRRGVAIVTNEALAEDISRRCVRALIMHDYVDDSIVDDGEQFSSAKLSGLQKSNWVLVPLAYASDEPLAEILDAARLRPDIQWILTGNAPNALVESAPENVVFPGYLSNSEYEKCVCRCSAIVALTTKENTMQRAGYEALSATQPLVTSSTGVLEAYFEDAALFINPNADEIAAAVWQAISEAPQLRQRMEALKAKKKSLQSEQLADLVRWMDVS